MQPINRREMFGQTCSSGSLAAAPSPADTSLRKLKVLVTRGHPGDPEYGCGRTIARLKNLGDELVLHYLNDGVPAGKPH
jgi:hypothetical protein